MYTQTRYSVGVHIKVRKLYCWNSAENFVRGTQGLSGTCNAWVHRLCVNRDERERLYLACFLSVCKKLDRRCKSGMWETLRGCNRGWNCARMCSTVCSVYRARMSKGSLDVIAVPVSTWLLVLTEAFKQPRYNITRPFTTLLATVFSYIRVNQPLSFLYELCILRAPYSSEWFIILLTADVNLIIYYFVQFTTLSSDVHVLNSESILRVSIFFFESFPSREKRRKTWPIQAAEFLLNFCCPTRSVTRDNCARSLERILLRNSDDN